MSTGPDFDRLVDLGGTTRRLGDCTEADLDRAIEFAERRRVADAWDRHMARYGRGCPTCGARPGEPCLTVTGRPMTWEHTSRRPRG